MEIIEAQTRLADPLDHDIDSFCYPHGGYDPATFART
jgi:hypothetical protein